MPPQAKASSNEREHPRPLCSEGGTGKHRTGLAVLVNFSSQEPDLESYGELARRYEDAGAHAPEINMCCPNFGLADPRHGVASVEPGALTGQSPELAAAVTRIVRDAVRIPVIPKLTPTATDVGAVARACQDAGAPSGNGRL